LLRAFVVILADRTNGRAHATVLCPSVVCNASIVAKWCVLPKNFAMAGFTPKAWINCWCTYMSTGDS